MSDECPECYCENGRHESDCSHAPQEPSELAPESGSAPIPSTAATEMWDVFVRHKLNYEQCINVMVATTKMIGRKASNDEVGAFCMFLHKAMKICPELGDVAKEPNDQAH